MNVPRVRHIGDVVAGDPLPTTEIVVTLTSFVAYAAATWDFHRYHYDDAFVKRTGQPAPFMDGQMIGALLARELMTWGGPDAFVRRLSYQQRSAVYVDDTIIVSGKVTGVTTEEGRACAQCQLSVTKPDGTLVVRDAPATVELGHKGP